MTESAPVKILRTIVGDSYGNILSQDEPSGMSCDEDKTKSYSKEETQDSNEEFQKETPFANEEGLASDEFLNEPDETFNNTCDGVIEQSVNVNGEEINSAPGQNSVLMKEEETVVSTDLDLYTSNTDVVAENSEKNHLMQDENDVNVNNELKLEDDTSEKGKNSGDEMNDSDDETKENISRFVPEQSNMEDFDTENQPVKKLHSIHLTTKAFCEETGDESDRQSQLSLFDADDECELSPMGLHANLTSARSDNRPQTTSTMRDVPGGLRAKANTPASCYNVNRLDTPTYQNEKVSARVSSRESRDEVFHRAMTLMSNRCTSARGGDENNLLSSKEPPFGIYIPQYFYVHQKKPQSLTPLKAWRGYKGNVYFEPMLIQKLQDSTQYTDDIPKQMPSRSTLRSAPLPQSRNSNSVRGLLSSSSSSRPYRLVNSSNQLYVLDKTMLVSSSNLNRNTELNFIEGLESTGSLTVSQPTIPNKNSRHVHQQPNKDKRLLYKRDRICKGPNFHKSKDKSEIGNNRNNRLFTMKISEPKKKLITPDNSRRTSGTSSKMSLRKQIMANGSANSKLRKSNQTISDLVVSGDKFAPTPVVLSPMLNTTERRHPLSKSRVTMEDVDAYVNASDNLPRVNQVHVSLDHVTDMDSLHGMTTPYSDIVSNDEDSDSVDYVDMNFKGLTTTVPVDSGY